MAINNGKLSFRDAHEWVGSHHPRLISFCLWLFLRSSVCEKEVQGGDGGQLPWLIINLDK